MESKVLSGSDSRLKFRNYGVWCNMSETESPSKDELSFLQQVKSFPANYWFALVMETLERLAYFAVRAIAPLYLIKSSADNGLGLDYTQKGIIYTVWAFIQCLVPMVSGGYTDRYGYRKSLAVAFTINIIGYLGMAQSIPIAEYLGSNGWENPGFWVFFAAACLVGLGTAIFKPPVQGTIAKTTDEKTSSLGWGIFYWVVNIGGALAPMVAAVLRREIDWTRVFYFAVIVTAINFLPAFLLYKEPEKEPPKDGSLQSKGPFGVFFSSILTFFKDLRLVVFLGICSCFWLMFMQLWDLLPNFIDEWVNSADVAPAFAWFSKGWVLANGQTKPEMIINIDAIAIILLVIPISWALGRISKVAAMIIGMVIALIGFVAAGATSIGWFCCVMVFVFSIGEMACSPTFNAYIGLIAPKDKKALYMGYANIPFAIGWAAGGFMGNLIYEAIGNKTRLAREFMVNNLGMDPSVVLDHAKLPKEQVMDKMAAALHNGAGGTVQEATRILWDLHHPYMVWYYLGGIGLVGTIGMILFYLVTRSRDSGQESQPA